MKINALTETVYSVNAVHGKQDHPSGGNQKHERNPSEEKQPQDELSNATPEEVTQAVEAFGKDSQAQAAGLTASVLESDKETGSGPGLRVVLKDVSGHVIRQFTGEEFLKIREGASKDASGPGKILDQKL